jgi:hypothetical protein
VNDLSEAMRVVTETPPPTRIDIDELIRADRRRTRTNRWLAAAGGVVALAALAGGAQIVTSGHRPSAAQPGGPATMAPGHVTPGVDPNPGTADRLTTVLRPVLIGALPPGYTLTIAPIFAWEDSGPGYGGYRATGTVTGPDGELITVTVTLRRTPMPTDTACVKNDPPDVICSMVNLPDGSQNWMVQGDDGVNQPNRSVERYADDPGIGASLTWVTEAAASLAQLPFSTDQLADLAATPTLHL